MTEPEPTEWEERLRQAVAETIRQRAARKELRQQLDAARVIGLQRRHHAKLHNRKDTP